MIKKTPPLTFMQSSFRSQNLRPSVLSRFFLGLKAPLAAITLIFRSRRILALLAIPMLVSVVLYSIFFIYGVRILNEFTTSLYSRWADELPPWLLQDANLASFAQSALHILVDWVLRILLYAGLVLISALSFSLVSGLLLSPFNDKICRETLRILQEKTLALTNQSKDIIVMTPVLGASHPFHTVIKLEIKRMGVLLMVGAFAFCLGVVPLMQIPALMIAAWALAFEYFGYPISQYSPDLTVVRRFTSKNFASSFGFGITMLSLMAIPFGSLIYIPLAVVGSSWLFYRLGGEDQIVPTHKS